MMVYLKFTAAQAKTAARIFNKRIATDPLGDKFDADGWYRPDPNGPAYYYNFDLCFGTGRVYSTAPTGTAVVNGLTVPTYTLRPGVHVNLLWTGPENLLPTQLTPFRVYPVTPAVVFG